MPLLSALSSTKRKGKKTLVMNPFSQSVANDRRNKSVNGNISADAVALVGADLSRDVVGKTSGPPFV